MKKTLTLSILFIGVLSFGQVGIGTPSPRGALDINKPTTNNMGLVLPTNSNVNNIINPLGGGVIPGTIIYDSTNDCVRLYQGTNRWSNCLSDTTCEANAPIVLDCSGIGYTGTLTSGVPASGVSSLIPYTGGDGSHHNDQTVTSTGVTGLTATLSAGDFANGDGFLIYTITGTPDSSGIATFIINISGQTCTITRDVEAGAPPIESLDCAGATQNGTLTNGVAASGVSTVISYTGGNGNTHNGQTVSSTGVDGLTATLSPGSFANGNGNLTYIITGTPLSAGTASFAINIGGQTCTITRNVGAGAGVIGSLNCANATHNGTLTSGTAASGVSSVISYTGGNGNTHNGQTVPSTGVNGLTAKLSPGSFANGNGTLTYTITGTPNSSGTASFAINIGGQNCTITRTVVAGIPPIDTSISCTGATIPGSGSSFTVKGKSVTATFSNAVNTNKTGDSAGMCDGSTISGARYTFFGATPTGTSHNGVPIYSYNTNASVRITFNRPITNFKVFHLAIHNDEKYVYTFKKNGTIVHPTMQLICNLGSHYNISSNTVTSKIRNGNTDGTYVAGGAWFDEVLISATQSGGLSYPLPDPPPPMGSTAMFCVGDAQ